MIADDICLHHGVRYSESCNPDVIVDGTPNLRMSTLPIETRQDEAFATHSQERIMGLLGAMIPPKDKVSCLLFLLLECCPCG